MLVFAAQNGAEHAPQHEAAQRQVGQGFPAPDGIAQAFTAALADQHPDQRHRHQHAHRVADAEAQQRGGPLAGRDTPRQRQQRHVTDGIEQGAGHHDAGPGQQTAPVVEHIAAAETAAQGFADHAVAQYQPGRTEQGQWQAGRQAAHQHFGAEQGDEPGQCGLAAMDQPEYQAQRGIGIPGRDVQAIHRIDVSGPVKQQVQADKGGVLQMAGQGWAHNGVFLTFRIMHRGCAQRHHMLHFKHR